MRVPLEFWSLLLSKDVFSDKIFQLLEEREQGFNGNKQEKVSVHLLI